MALASYACIATKRASGPIERTRQTMILDASTPETTPARLRSLIASFKGKRILVIGDMVADQYLIGRPTRISREAPVLILELDEERTIPGGASNVAVNANSLGAEVFLTGVIGDDLPG